MVVVVMMMMMMMMMMIVEVVIFFRPTNAKGIKVVLMFNTDQNVHEKIVNGYSTFKFLYFHILIKHKKQELGRKECGGVKMKTHGVKKCLHT